MKNNEEVILNILKKNFSITSIDGNSNLKLDSLAIVKFVLILEKEFNIKIPSVDVNENHFKNVCLIADYVVLRMNINEPR